MPTAQACRLHNAVRAAFASLLVLACGVHARADADGRQTLLEGVRSIAAPGAPGPLSLVGQGAFAVVEGRSGRDRMAAVVAAGTLGKGRVVAFGHTGYLDAESLEAVDTGRLMQNAVRWAGKVDAPRVVVVRAKGTAVYLEKHGFKVEEIAIDALSNNLSCDVLIAGSHDLRTEPVRAAVERFAARGGGLILAGLGWGWQQLNASQDLVDDHPGNIVLRASGIAWADGILSRTDDNGFAAGPIEARLLNASEALAALGAHQRGDAPLRPQDLTQAGSTVALAVRAFPIVGNPVVERLNELGAAMGASAVPSAARPLKAESALERAVLTAQLLQSERLPPERVQAHAAAEHFPGSVPADAARVTKSVTVDAAVPGWHSTGLYAAPGEVIAVALPPDATRLGLHVRIGCHSDKLWDLDVWRRSPEIVLRRPLLAAVTRVANPFGGLVYIEAPGKGETNAVKVAIRGAVEAPFFVLGSTPVAEWRDSIRQRPAPWAELATDRVIVSVPSRVIRTLDDPEPLLKVWNEILDACADLACRPRDRQRPERYVADEQISAGYMHAGYPIMTHLDAAEPMVSREKLLAGQWGLFHEMGHNHQSGDWTFAGTGEVTVNLFSLYVMETVCKLDGPGHSAVLIGPRRVPAYEKYVAGGRNFEAWKADPFLALTMYVQLREAFGWEAYKTVFAEYRDLPANQRPRSDDEKRDQWMVRFSRTVNRNLGPFFEAWGVPTSAEARASIADLPAWWPEDFPRNATPRNRRG
jgi:hypothetical protein